MSSKQQQKHFSSTNSFNQIFFYFRIIFIFYFLIQKLDAYSNFYSNEIPIQNVGNFLSQRGERNEGENNGNLKKLKEEIKLNDGNHHVFFGRPISSLGDLQQTFTEGLLETPSSGFVRSAANKLMKKAEKEEKENKKENEIINTIITNNRQPRANNAKLARKNCFFSPLQCSFYYKSNSNFANMLIRGDE
ncbi:hypothetical protein ACQ4LE_006235 [Meloidogyne hapla]